MKKIAGILICIALAFSFAGCSWQMPEKVSVKTNADYNFSLGNVDKDFGEKLNVSKLIGDLKLPNDGKLYDYWPNKSGDEQKYLMYMPLQEIPIDISKYFDKGSLAENIKNISFEKEIEVPSVGFSLPVDIDLDTVHEEINKKFVLAGFISDYNADQLSGLYSSIAESISYEKGYLVVKAYQVNPPASGTFSIEDAVNEDDVDTTYSGGRVTITSGGKSISGYFSNGIAEIAIPSGGFEFITNDINVSFSDKTSIPVRAFVARINMNKEPQLKKIKNISSALTIPEINIPTKKIDSLKNLSSSGVEECKIGEGSILVNFEIPSTWDKVVVKYSLKMQGETGGINIDEKNIIASSEYTTEQNKHSISLAGQSITADEITVDAKLNLTVTGATIDFTKKPAIGMATDISKIETVTVKLSDTELSFNKEQKLPDEALKVLEEITLNECGIKGTYVNELPAGNDITLTVSSNFFGITNKDVKIESGKTGTAQKGTIELVNEGVGTVKLSADDPLPSETFNAFDFDVNVTLPGGKPNSITVQNVEPGKKYKLAIDIEPVINWESVKINTSSLPSKSDTISTGFNPTSIFTSINDVLGEGFSDKIEIPGCTLHLYLTKPNLGSLNTLNFNSSTIKMFYGKSASESAKPEKIGTYEKYIINNGKYTDSDGSTRDIDFASAAPDFTTEKITEDSETVTSAISAASLSLPISDLLKSTTESQTEGAKLCIDYNISLSDIGPLTIESKDLDSETAGSIGIYAVIELPLSFNITDNTEIDLQKLMNKDNSEDKKDDLFGRSEASGFDQVKKYLEVIQEAKIQYRPDAFPIKTTDDIKLQVVLDDKNDNDLSTNVFSDTIELRTSGSGELSIDADQIESVLNAYPLKLEAAKILLGKNQTISIPREKKIDVNLQVGIKTDGTIELFGN